MKVKRGADADHRGGVYPLSMPRHPLFLLGGPQAYPKNIRTSVVDHLHDLLVLFGPELSKGRAVRAGDLQAGKSPLQFLGKAAGNPFRATVEEVAVSAL
jgi:hypothetical protein